MLLVLRSNSDAVILNGEEPFLPPPLGRDMDLGRNPAFVPDRVAHEILEELLQLDIMHADAGQIGTGNGGAALLDGSRQIGKRLVQTLA